MPLNRRRVLSGAALAGSALAAAGCAPSGGGQRYRWNLVTTWPAGSPGLGEAAVRLARWIERASQGRLRITVHGGGERVAPFDVFEAVAMGRVEMGHGAAYFWQRRAPAAVFFASVPFGLNAQEMNGWLLHGEGLSLWRELYAGFGLVPFAAGNTGVQTAGWYNREITSVADLRGLKIRMPGLGGDVMRRLGAVPVQVAGVDMVAALRSGAIDACEWLGPWQDLHAGLHRAARYCYFPGWQEPGTTLECIVNKTALESLPESLQVIVELACRAVNEDLLAQFTVRNIEALGVLRREQGAMFRLLPATVLEALRLATDAELASLAASDAFARRTLASFSAFREGVRGWHAMSEVAFYHARS